jgi:hypothetical protein
MHTWIKLPTCHPSKQEMASDTIKQAQQQAAARTMRRSNCFQGICLKAWGLQPSKLIDNSGTICLLCANSLLQSRPAGCCLTQLVEFPASTLLRSVQGCRIQARREVEQANNY